jgi:hypothetical protein
MSELEFALPDFPKEYTDLLCPLAAANLAVGKKGANCMISMTSHDIAQVVVFLALLAIFIAVTWRTAQ